MSDNKPYNLNITFKYDYFDKKLQKHVKYDYNILKEGKFLHSAIRNQNFYDNIIDNYTDNYPCPSKGNQSCDKIKLAIEQADNNDNKMNLGIPFSNKYIDLNILDKIIINEGKDKSKNEKLGFDEFVKYLNTNKNDKYETSDFKSFIDDILKLFTQDNNNKTKAIKEVNEKIQTN